MLAFYINICLLVFVFLRSITRPKSAMKYTTCTFSSGHLYSPIIPQYSTLRTYIPGLNEFINILDHVYCRWCWLTLSVIISTDTWPLCEPSVDRYTANISATTRPDECVDRYGFSLIDTRPIPYRYLTDGLPILYRYSVDTLWTKCPSSLG